MHNNTTPDDIPICEALLAYLRSGGNMAKYWEVLTAAKITNRNYIVIMHAQNPTAETCLHNTMRYNIVFVKIVNRHTTREYTTVSTEQIFS